MGARLGLGLAAGVVGISFAAIFVRLALPAPPVVTGVYRTAIAAALLAAWQAARGRPLLPPLGARGVAFGAGLCFGADLALWHTAIVETSVANATLLVNTTPIWVGLVAWLGAGERPGPRFAVAVGLALAGTALLLGSQPAGAAGLRGDALALGAALFYSGYLLLAKAARRHGDTLPVLLTATVGATATLAAVALVRGDPLSGFPPRAWAAILGAALVSQTLGVLAIVWALRYARATFASLALLGQPVGTSLLGWWLLGEALGPVQALGGAAVLAGIALAAREAAEPALATQRRPAREPIG